MAKHDERGREIPDPRPVEMPLNFRRPLTLQEQIKRAIRLEMSDQARASGMETFEEADDFSVDDDGDEFVSPHELTPMQEDAQFREFPEKVEVEDGSNGDSRGAPRGPEALDRRRQASGIDAVAPGSTGDREGKRKAGDPAGVAKSGESAA